MATDEPPAKTSQGRKRIEMKLIKNKTSRMVAFSKRRASLFRKASELGTLFNSQVALMIFSPGGKIYSFGHPSVGAVVERYESSTRNIGGSRPIHLFRAEFMRLTAVRAEKTMRLKMVFQQIMDLVEAEKDKIEMLDKVWEEEHAKRHWWNAPVEEMNVARCKALKKKLTELRIKVEAELKMRNQAEASKKDMNIQDTPAKIVAPNVGDLSTNRSPGVLSNNLVAEWIYSAAHSRYYMSGPSNSASGSTMTTFQGSGFYNLGGGTNYSASLPGSSSSTVGARTSHGLAPKSYGVGPNNHPNFNNFTF